MRTRKLQYIWLLITWSLILLLSGTFASAQQDNGLPTDLIFTAGIEHAGTTEDTMSLVRLDAKTATLKLFYTDNTATSNGLRALKWSPDGNLLVIYRSQHIHPQDPNNSGYLDQLCVLTRQGVLQTCLADQPVSTWSSSGDQLSTVSWSPDSQRLYFVNQTASTVRVLEAEVSSGQTLRTLYEYPNDGQEGIPPLLSWSFDLTQVLVGGGDSDRASGRLPEFLINLQTRKSVSLYSVISAPAIMGWVCLDFSPKDTYMVAIDMIPPNEFQFVIFDKRAHVVQIVGSQSGFRKLFGVSCPTWQQDEQAFYFVGAAEFGGRANVFRFSLEDKRLTIVHNVPDNIDLSVNSREASFEGAFHISLDGKILAATGLGNPHPGELAQVTLIFADGHTQDFLGSYNYTSDPLWMPLQPLTSKPK